MIWQSEKYEAFSLASTLTTRLVQIYAVTGRACVLVYSKSPNTQKIVEVPHIVMKHAGFHLHTGWAENLQAQVVCRRHVVWIKRSRVSAESIGDRFPACNGVT